MPKYLTASEIAQIPFNQRMRHEDGTPVHAPKVAPPEPVKLEPVATPDMSQVVAAIRGLGDRPDGMGELVAAIQELAAKEPEKQVTKWIFTVERDDNGFMKRVVATAEG
jgi:hypothetical protein